MNLPHPLVPPDLDLTDYQFMPLDVSRLRDSRIAVAVSGEEFRCAVLLWCASWHQVPAGSLPDDDIELSSLAGFGRVIIEWKKVSIGALHGWIKCSDGRLYHPVVAEKAIEGWNSKRSHRWKRECDRLRKENLSREKGGLPPLELPPRPHELAVGSYGNPTEIMDTSKGNEAYSAGNSPETPKLSDGKQSQYKSPSAGIPTENALKGQGQGYKKEDSCPESAVPAVQGLRKTYPEEFEDWWKAYPTSENMPKKKAYAVWSRLSLEDRRKAMAGIPGFVAYCRKNLTYQPVYADRWLSEARFESYAAKTRSDGTAPGREARIDFGGGYSAPESAVVEAMRKGEWFDGWGPKRGEPGCRVPDRLIQAAAGEQRGAA